MARAAAGALKGKTISAKQRAAAFRDAVQDILRDEGLFRLADSEEPRLIWAFDGHRWMQQIVDGGDDRHRPPGAPPLA
jgi:hypothetical protein